MPYALRRFAISLAAPDEVRKPRAFVRVAEERAMGHAADQVIHPVGPVLAQLPHAKFYTTTPQTVSHRPYHKGLSLPHPSISALEGFAAESFAMRSIRLAA